VRLDRRIFFFIGMAFFHAWIYTTNSAPVFAQGSDNLLLRIIHTGTTLAVLLLIILLRRHINQWITSLPFIIAITTTSLIGTLIIACSYLADTLPFVLVATGSFLTACSTATLLAVWGEAYSRISQPADQAMATIAALPCSFIIYLLTAALPVVLSFVVLSTFPLVIAGCVWKVISAKKNAERVPDAQQRQRCLEGLPDRGLLRLMFYIAVISVPLNYLNIFLGERLEFTGSSGWTAVYSISLLLFVGMIVLESLLRKRNITILPALIVILITTGLFLHFFFDSSSLAVMTFVASGYSLFVAIFYCYLGADTLLLKRAPFLVFAFGNCANTIGQVLGWLLGWLVGGFLLPLTAYIAVGIVYCVLFAGLFLMPPKRNFFNTGNAGDAGLSGDETEKDVSSLFLEGVRHQCSLAATSHLLSNREQEILEYLVRGRNLNTIANEIGVSRNTVKTHVEHIYQKFNVHSREELIILIENTESATVTNAS
jgi:DNA-binding CsgD family transcriptional regulator